MIKTTERHYQLFQQSVHKWMDKLHVHGWDVFFQHDETDGAVAVSYFKTRSRSVTIDFCKEWPDFYKLNEASIDLTAKHEVIRILLWPIAGLALCAARREDVILDDEILKEYADITLRLRELIVLT